MSNKSSKFAILLSVVALAIAVKAWHPSQSSDSIVAAKSESQAAYQRVVKSGTIRCGYAMWPTYLDKNPNTGEMSGIFYDYMTELGKLIGVKIEWTMEVGYGDFIEALHTGKIDAFCGGGWTSPIRAKVATFIRPLFYQPLLAYVKEGDTRFDGDTTKLNADGIKIAVIDGEGSELTARQFFAKAQFLQLPQLTDPSQMLTNVATGKADATLTDSVTADQYMKSNPGKIRAVPSEFPVTLYGASIWINQDEPQLKHWLETATAQLISGGVIEQSLKKFEPFPNAYWRARLDYIPPAQE